MRFGGFALGVSFALIALSGCNGQGGDSMIGPSIDVEHVKNGDTPGASKLCKDHYPKYSAQDNLGNAIKNVNANCAQKAIEAGADVNAKTRNGFYYYNDEIDYPLNLLMKNMSYSNFVEFNRTMRTLIRNGASVATTTNKDGRNIIDQIIDKTSGQYRDSKTGGIPHIEILSAALMKVGWDYVIPSVNKRPLAWAISTRKNLDYIKALINKGANAKSTVSSDSNGSMLDLAVASRSSEEVCLYIYDQGASLDSSGYTLAHAIKYGYAKLYSEGMRRQKYNSYNNILNALVDARWVDRLEQLMDAQPQAKIHEFPTSLMNETIRSNNLRLFNKLWARASIKSTSSECYSSPLENAIANERIDFVNRMLELGFDVNHPNCPAIEKAAQYKSIKIYKIILAKTIFSSNSKAQLLLRKVNSLEKFDEMVSAGADPNYVDDRGKTNLDYFLDQIKSDPSPENMKIAEKLINSGSKFDENSTTSIVRSGQISLLKALIARGINVNRMVQESVYVSSAVPLIYLSADIETMQALIDAGANIKALAADQTNMINYILSNEMNSNNLFDKTMQKLKFLDEKHKIRWTHVNAQGETTLLLIMKKDCTPCNKEPLLQLAIERGAELNAKEIAQGNTALHLAQDSATIQMLIKAGANKTIQNKAGNTPYQTMLAKVSEAQSAAQRYRSEAKAVDERIDKKFRDGKLMTHLDSNEREAALKNAAEAERKALDLQSIANSLRP